jgi:hypothetical protein
MVVIADASQDLVTSFMAAGELRICTYYQVAWKPQKCTEHHAEAVPWKLRDRDQLKLGHVALGWTELGIPLQRKLTSRWNLIFCGVELKERCSEVDLQMCGLHIVETVSLVTGLKVLRITMKPLSNYPLFRSTFQPNIYWLQDWSINVDSVSNIYWTSSIQCRDAGITKSIHNSRV